MTEACLSCDRRINRVDSFTPSVIGLVHCNKFATVALPWRMASTSPFRAVPRSAWTLRFAERLRELIPMLPDAMAYSVALSLYPRASDLQPETVAERYASEPGTGHPA